jgi:acetate kinase
MPDCLAVLNAGSSSIKFALYAAYDEALLFRGQIESIGLEPRLKVRDAAGGTVAEQRWPPEDFDHSAATRQIVRVANDLLKGSRVVAVGHRVVHGGMNHGAPVRIDPGVIDELERLVPLAPLHQPHNLAPIRAIIEHAPKLPQVACFDTAFHRSQSATVQSFALPRKYFAEGVRRYGFHGLSYEYVASEMRRVAPSIAGGRLIIAHLGNGASLCAVHEGRSVASTMGFTAVDGLMMGTRCGTIDPGVILYLMDRHGMDARAVEDLVYRKSGLLGISGISSDMRTLRASAAPEAAEAIALFVHRIIREIGSLAAALGGLDGLFFTAGIGENDPATRSEVAEACAWLGLKLDHERNSAGAGRVSADSSSVQAWVVPTNEELMIARHTAATLKLTS